MNGYTKVFGTILTSTIWQEPVHVKIVWITMLALSDAEGRVKASVPGLAHVAGVTLEQCEGALCRFLAPDKYSRTQDHEGRRITVMPGGGGWLLLNHDKYKRMMSWEERREQMREAARRYRNKARPQSAEMMTDDDASSSVIKNHQNHQTSSHTDTDTNTDLPPSPSEMSPLPGDNKPRGRRGARMREDWEPKAETVAWIRSLGVDPAPVVEEFKDYWLGESRSGSAKADWDRALKARVRNVVSAKRRATGEQTTKQPYDPNAPWLKVGGE